MFSNYLWPETEYTHTDTQNKRETRLSHFILLYIKKTKTNIFFSFIHIHYIMFFHQNDFLIWSVLIDVFFLSLSLCFFLNSIITLMNKILNFFFKKKTLFGIKVKSKTDWKKRLSFNSKAKKINSDLILSKQTKNKK